MEENTNMLKSPIKYGGGKGKEIPFILPYIPSFSGSYIEPFFGGGVFNY